MLKQSSKLVTFSTTFRELSRNLAYFATFLTNLLEKKRCLKSLKGTRNYFEVGHEMSLFEALCDFKNSQNIVKLGKNLVFERFEVLEVAILVRIFCPNSFVSHTY